LKLRAMEEAITLGEVTRLKPQAVNIALGCITAFAGYQAYKLLGQVLLQRTNTY